MEWIQISLFTLVMIFVLLSVYYSFRYRRQRDLRLRALYSARMNICMGIMLIFISITQLFLFQDSAVRRTFGTICLLLGLFNLFAGLRNHRMASRAPQFPKDSSK